jgi:hypothetical protein
MAIEKREPWSERIAHGEPCRMAFFLHRERTEHSRDFSA